MQSNDRRKYNGKKPTWDVAAGARMYADGVAIFEIAKALEQPYYRVYDYARRNWYAKMEA